MSGKAEARFAGMVALAATRMLGVTGTLQTERDVVLVREYESDREACEAAIEAAQDELNHATDDDGIAWAWHALDEAYVHLAHVVAREALARRRGQLTKR